MEIYTLIYTEDTEFGYDCEVKVFRTLDEASKEMRKQFYEKLEDRDFHAKGDSAENRASFQESCFAYISIGTDDEYYNWSIQKHEV